MDYVRMESADAESAAEGSLRFLRTARVSDVSYWLWSYTESTGTTCFVAFRRNANGATMLVLTETNGLSPEQYLLADYYNEVYWA